MDILAVPFHKYLNIETHSGADYIFELKEKPEFLNHLQTIHACVQLSLAEASSGEFLLQEFKEFEDEVIPVIRRTEVKYHRPANGTLYSRAFLQSSRKAELVDELMNKGRTVIQIKVEIFDRSKKKVLTAIFDWFLKRIQTP